ncbi:MAG: hypothetical protein LUI13_01625 [Lachnospiraceae bacterium]|nr:hypothetical protein [Lachnospiraceae bacterium]
MGEISQDKQNQIDALFDIYLSRTVTDPGGKQKAVEPYLETISEDFDEKLFDYIGEVQKSAYYAGFATGVQLMQDCYAESKKIIARQ